MDHLRWNARRRGYPVDQLSASPPPKSHNREVGFVTPAGYEGGRDIFCLSSFREQGVDRSNNHEVKFSKTRWSCGGRDAFCLSVFREADVDRSRRAGL